MEGGQEGARQTEESPAEALWMGALGPSLQPRPHCEWPTAPGSQVAPSASQP